MVSLPSRYSSPEPIGKGLSGAVYRAYDKQTHRDVAIKVFVKKPEGIVWQYFTNEATILRKLTEHRCHPHILEYIDSNFNKSPYYLTTAFIDGVGLHEQIGGRPQPAWLVASVVDQVASALDYLHHGHPQMSPIVHRDIKPQNILLDRRYNAVVIDFSIASHEGFGIEDEKNIGTPGYMAPEQYAGAGHEKPASDQFALAVVAIEMLTGKAPLPNHTKTALDKLKQWQETDYAEIKRSLGARRPRATEVLIKALHPDPAQRYPNCELFADELRRALAADGEVVTPPANLPPMKSSFNRTASVERVDLKRPEWVVFSLLVMAAIVVLLIGIWIVSSPVTGNAKTTAATTPAQPTLAPSPTSQAPITGGQIAVTPAMIPTLAPIATATTVLVSPNTTVMMKQREPLRAGPSTDTKILLWMPQGATAERTGREERASAGLTWYEVVYQGQIGWCRSIFCQPQ